MNAHGIGQVTVTEEARDDVVGCCSNPQGFVRPDTIKVLAGTIHRISVSVVFWVHHHHLIFRLPEPVVTEVVGGAVGVTSFDAPDAALVP